MSLFARIAKVGCSFALVALAFGCGPRGPAVAGGTGPQEKKELGELKQRDTQEHMWTAGANVHRWTLFYEGGPNESWAFDVRGNPPPELENKPGYWHLDDDDVKEPVEPENGAPRVPLQVPRFCDRYSGAGLEMNFETIHMDFLEDKDPGAVLGYLRAVAWAACDRMRYEPRQKRVQKLLQIFVNETKMPLDKLDKLLEGLAETKEKDDLCGSDATSRWIACGAAPEKGAAPDIATLDIQELEGKSSDEARFAIAMSKFAWGTPYSVRSRISMKNAYNPSHTAVRLEPAKFETKGLSQDAGRHLVAQAAVLAVEAQQIDWDTLALTLLAKEKNEAVRYLLERRIVQWRKAIETSIASLGDKVAKAKSVEEAWRKDVLEPNKDAVKAAFTAIRTPSAKEACATADAAFEKAVTAKSPKSWKEATALLQDPAIDLFAQARQRCHDANGDKLLAKLEDRMLAKWGRRSVGPRVTAYRELNEWPQRSDLFDFPPERVVKSASAKGESIEIGFEPEEWTEHRESCKETNIIDGITWEGKIEYRVSCVALEPLKHKDPLPNVTMPKSAASELKKGHVISMVEESGRPTVIVYDYPTKKAAAADTDLAAFLGIVLKR